MTDLPARPIDELAGPLRAGQLGVTELAVACLDACAAGTRADHYAWMRAPDAVADWLVQPASA